MKFQGDTINDGLHSFKLWFSDFAIELSPILVLIGMLMTGVDIYLNGRLATQTWFEVPWAIVQVIAVDGLWFAVWLRILTHKHERKWGAWLWFLSMIGVGLAMLIVAFIMNDIVLFQQVNSIASSLGAMSILGIPIAIFTHFRAGLLVATATLAMLFSRKRHSQDSPQQAMQGATAIAITEEGRANPRATKRSQGREKATVIDSPNQAQKAIPERVTLGMVEETMYKALMSKPEEASELLCLSEEKSLDDFTAILKQRYSQYANYITPQRVASVLAYARSHSQAEEANHSNGHSPRLINRSLETVAMHSPANGYVAMATAMHSPNEKANHSPADRLIALEESTDTHHSMAIIAVGSQGYRDKIKAIWLQHIQEGRAINLKSIALDAGVGYSTVKKWANDIREEIALELQAEHQDKSA